MAVLAELTHMLRTAESRKRDLHVVKTNSHREERSAAMKPSIRGMALVSLVLALIWSGVPTLHAQLTAHAGDASKASGSVLSTQRPRHNVVVKGTVLSLSWDRYPGAAYYY